MSGKYPQPSKLIAILSFPDGQLFIFVQVSEMKAEYFPPKVDIIIQNEIPTDFYILVSGSVVCNISSFSMCIPHVVTESNLNYIYQNAGCDLVQDWN